MERVPTIYQTVLAERYARPNRCIRNLLVIATIWFPAFIVSSQDHFRNLYVVDMVELKRQGKPVRATSNNARREVQILTRPVDPNYGIWLQRRFGRIDVLRSISSREAYQASQKPIYRGIETHRRRGFACSTWAG
jgi:hypothetical protein